MNKPDILYEDASVLVCVKPAKLATQTSRVSEQDLYSILKNRLHEADRAKAPYLAVIHRLDQPVSGLLVFAKTKEAAAELSRQLTKDSFTKEYLALITKRPERKEDTLVDWLLKDGKSNTSRVVQEGTKEAKRAELSYQVIDSGQELEALLQPQAEAVSIPEGTTLIKVRLKTGRHHQIRVQMAHAGFPLYGDTKYNPEAGKGGWQQIALCACHLKFKHPVTGKAMEFSILPGFLKK